MPQNDFGKIVEKYVEMNVAHPFREGNGRSARLWLDQMLKRELGSAVDWSLINSDDFHSAMARSPVSDAEIKSLLRRSLTNDVLSKEVFLSGIDQSFAFEGFKAFKFSELYGIYKSAQFK